MSGNNQNPIRPEPWAIAGNYRNLPGGGLPGSRAAFRGISYASEQQARGSRWFGPNGAFGPARTLPLTATQEAGAGDNEISNPITHNFHRGYEPAMAPTPANPATTYPVTNYRAASYPAASYQATNYMYPTTNYRAASYPAASYPATIPIAYPAPSPSPNTTTPTTTPPAAHKHEGDLTPTTLVPSRMQQVSNAQLDHAPRAPRRDLKEAGVSSNYRGDISNPRNLSAKIPEDRSCSFWLRGLPADTTVTTLLAAVRAIGRVYCTVITPACRAQGWVTAAAKLVFFEQQAAQRFWALYGRGSGGGGGGDAGGGATTPPLALFFVGGQRVFVERNRTRVAESSLPRDYTRVVRVTGPAGVVDVGALLTEFQEKFVFEMDEVAIWTEDRVTVAGVQRLVVVEFRFGSFRCQAQTAHRLLQGRAGLEVRYGRDPCDR